RVTRPSARPRRCSVSYESTSTPESARCSSTLYPQPVGLGSLKCTTKAPGERAMLPSQPPKGRPSPNRARRSTRSPVGRHGGGGGGPEADFNHTLGASTSMSTTSLYRTIGDRGCGRTTMSVSADMHIPPRVSYVSPRQQTTTAQGTHHRRRFSLDHKRCPRITGSLQPAIIAAGYLPQWQS